MKKPRVTFNLLLILLISGLLWLTGCADEYKHDDYDSHNKATADALNMSVVSSSIIELDWQKTESSYTYNLYSRVNGGENRLIYQGENNYYQDSGLQSGVMYCYQLQVCGEGCSPVSNSVCGTTRQWKSSDQAPWSARRYPAAVVFKNKLWVLGGEYFDSKILRQTYNDIWTFDGGKWLLATSSASWSPRGAHAGVVFQDKIWILGGLDSDDNPQNDVWSSSDGKNWKQVTDQAPWIARYLHTALVFQDKIWILAGREDSTLYTRNDVWSSSDGENWEQVADHAPWPEGEGVYHNFLIFQDKIWMLEGDERNISATRKIWSSSDGESWQNTTIQGSKHTVNNALVFKNRIWMTGGFYGEELSDEVWFSEDGLSWTLDNQAPWPGRYGHGSVVFQNKIWVFGGVESSPNYLEFNDVWSY